MGPKSKSAAANPFRLIIEPFEARLDALDAAVREIHPQYSDRILDRMSELEGTCRDHANRVMMCIDNQKKDMIAAANNVSKHVEHAVSDLEKRTAAAIERFHEVAHRHQTDAKALRCELGGLKELLDASSVNIAEERQNCQQLLEDARQLLSTLEENVKDARHLLSDVSKTRQLIESETSEVGTTHDFRITQMKLMSEARTAPSMAGVIRKAQSAAASRSPSKGVSREPSPARSGLSDNAASDLSYAGGRVRRRVSCGHLSEQTRRGRSIDVSSLHAAPMSLILPEQPQVDHGGATSNPFMPQRLHLPPVLPSVQDGSWEIGVPEPGVYLEEAWNDPRS